MFELFNDQRVQVQSRDPVTKYEPQLSKAMHVTISGITKRIFIDYTQITSLLVRIYYQSDEQPMQLPCLWKY